MRVKRCLGLGLREDDPMWRAQCWGADYDPGQWSELRAGDRFWCRQQCLRGVINPPGVEKLWLEVNEWHREASLSYPGEDKEHKHM